MNPIIAAILSFIIPGLGQAIQGDVKRGLIFFVIYVVLALIVNFLIPVFGIIFTTIYRIYAAYDTYKLGEL